MHAQRIKQASRIAIVTILAMATYACGDDDDEDE